MTQSSRQPPQGDREIIKARVCPVCNAQPGQACTTPTDTGRRIVNWVHLSREWI